MGRSKNREVFSLDGRSDTSELKRLVDVLDDLAGGIADLDAAGTKASRGADKAEKSLDKLADATIVAQGAFGALNAAAGVVAPAVDATIGALLDQESAMNRVEAATGLTGVALEDFEQQAEDVFNAGFGDSFSDVVAAMTEVNAITGATGDELEDFTRKAIGIGEAFDKDINETVRTADTLMETFGITQRDALDLLATGLRETGDPADDLLDTFNEYSANFSQLGIDADQALDILNQGLDAGARNTDDIADAYREFQIRLLDGSSEKAIQNLSTETQGLFKSFENGDATAVEVLDNIVEELNAIEDPLERNRLGVELFGTKFEDMGSDVLLGIDPIREGSMALEDMGGAADSVGDALEGGLGAAFDRAKRQIQTALVDAIEPFIPALEEKLPGAIQTGVTFVTGVLIPSVVGLANAMKPVVEDLFQFGNNILEAFGGKDAVLGAFATAGQGVANFLTFLSNIDLSAGLAAWTELGNIIDGILPAMQEKAAELFTVESFSEMLSAFGTNLVAALQAGLPVWGEWVNTNIIQPVMSGLGSLPGMIAQGLNDALPNDFGFEIPRKQIPGTGQFGIPAAYIGGQSIKIDLPDNPIPVPESLGNYATGGAFTVPNAGLPMAGTSDRQFMIGLTPGENVSVAPRGGGAGGSVRQPIILQLDGRTVYETIVEINNMSSNPGLATP